MDLMLEPLRKRQVSLLERRRDVLSAHIGDQGRGERAFRPNFRLRVKEELGVRVAVVARLVRSDTDCHADLPLVGFRMLAKQRLRDLFRSAREVGNP
jgi:hypothetical protein